MIRNVIFDIGNVLVHFRWRVLMEDLKLAKETQAVFEKTVFGSRWWGELDHGIYEEAEILAHFREDNKEHLDEFNLVWDNRDNKKKKKQQSLRLPNARSVISLLW